jgi:hypothetical protein
MKRVEIHWVDIIHSQGWKTLDELEEFDQEKAKTVVHLGFIFEEDEDQVILIDSYFEDKSLYGNVHIIPKGCIKQMKEI